MDTFFSHVYADCELRERFATKPKTQLVCNLTLHFVCPSHGPRKLQAEQFAQMRVCLHRGICCFPESRGVLSACLARGPGGEVRYFLEAGWLEGFA